MKHLLPALMLLVVAAPSFGADENKVAAARAEFVEKMVAQHDFSAADVRALLAEATIRNDIIEAISRPAERTLEWRDYQKIFLTEKRIAAGVDFWREHEDFIRATSEETGVAPEMLVSIIGIESFFGRITGKYRVLDALSTLAFAYPPRAKFFGGELEQFLLLTREEALQPTSALGSYAGAMGAPQFIPSSYRAYAVDGDGDGQRDLWDNWQDVIASIANYFEVHRWRSGEPIAVQATRSKSDPDSDRPNRLKLADTVQSLSDAGFVFATEQPTDAPTMLVTLEGERGTEYWVGFNNFYVITRYNRSVLYAMAARDLGNAIRMRVAAEPVARR